MGRLRPGREVEWQRKIVVELFSAATSMRVCSRTPAQSLPQG